jgi:hypothetical protein
LAKISSSKPLKSKISLPTSAQIRNICTAIVQNPMKNAMSQCKVRRKMQRIISGHFLLL